ncbi:uncharacterized protein LOC120355776 [Nilaparvata lugens]|uniref:uncharacterized protein LOC120355776 n=1 Tax=Nilaparvata lugens TaxID=108931 RepID=UPI00193D65BB|nr:uncharacterized protein LOC120355776 [Nilaparvata lugens]
MPCCAIAGCSNHSDKAKLLNISFHKFPKQDDLYKQWVHSCRRKDDFNGKTAVICSQHFVSDDFERDLKSELLKLPKKNILKKAAIPTVKIPSLPSFKIKKTESERSCRLIGRENRKIVQTLLDDFNNNADNVDIVSNEDIVSYVDSVSNVDIVNNEDNVDADVIDIANYKALLIENKKLKEINVMLEDEVERANNSILILENKLKNYERIFSNCQQQMISKGKCTNWSSDDVAKAVTIRCISKKGLDYIREILKYPLPSEKTIYRRLSQFSTPPGFLEVSFSLLRGQASIITNEFEKDVIMSFDEMKVRSEICYDSIMDVFRGPHVNVQVIIIRSVAGKWKQPIFYQFDQAITVDIFFQAIRLVEESGFRCRGFVSDMGGSNRKLVSDLGISQTKPSVDNPCCDDRAIWAFSDVPHVLKLIRNHLLDQGFELPGGIMVTKDILFDLIKQQNTTDLKYAYKITEGHLLLTGSERQNVRKAAELLSRTVAKAISYILPGNDHVVDFLTTVNDGFDVLNSRIPHHPNNKLKSGYGTSLELQNSVLNKLHDLCSSARVIGKKNLLPFQVGCMISIRSTQGLFNEMQLEGYQYLLTSRCNQDVLESFFSQIRGIGRFYDHPLPTTVSQRMKSLLFSKSASAILKTGNCTSEPCETLSVDVLTKVDCVIPPHSEEDSCMDDMDDKELDSVFGKAMEELSEQSQEEDIVENLDLLKVLSGYIAYRVFKKGISTTFNYGERSGQNASKNCDWLSFLSRGGLINPSDEWLKITIQFEKEFEKFHGEKLQKCSNVMSTLINVIKEKFDNIDDFAIECFVRTRSFIRMKELNKKNKKRAASNQAVDNRRKMSKKMKKIAS